MDYELFKKLSFKDKRRFYNENKHLGLDHPVMALDGNATLALKDVIDDIIPDARPEN